METIKQAISFGELLKTYRKRQGLTQQQLARKLDTHKNTIGAWERGDYLPVTRGMILELSQCLQLNDTEEHSLLEASLFTVTSRWSVPFQRNTLFTGRQATLQQIHQALSENPYAISSRSCALRGMAGIGKTQAAIEYAYRYARDYTAVFWIQANTEEDMLGCIAAIARILKLPTYGVSKREEMITLLLDWLQIHRNWLLIFDNVEENTFIQPFLSVARNGFFLMTTRLPTLGTLASCLELLPLPLEESIQLLLRRARMLPPPLPISEEETRALQAIVLAMDGLPLALDQAAAYIEESQCSFSEFLALLQSNLLLVLRERPFSVNYPRSVEQTFTQAFERLRQQNQLAADLLLFCSFLAPDEIPEALLNQMMSQLPDKFQADLSQPFRLSTAIKDLLGSALIRRNTHTKTLTVHCLVQTVLREQLPEAIQRTWIERLLHLLDQQFLVEHRHWCGQLAPHAQMVLQLADSLKITSAPASSLLLKTAAFLSEQTPSEQTEHLSIYSLAIQERANASELALTSVTLARTYLYQGTGRQREDLPFPGSPIQAKNALADQGSQNALPHLLSQVNPAREEEAPLDLFEGFLQECCVIAPQASCYAADLWQAYQVWTATQKKQTSLSRQALAFQMKIKGCQPERTNMHRIWRGIELKNPLLRQTLPAGEAKKSTVKLST